MLQVSRFGVRLSMKDVLLLYSSEYSIKYDHNLENVREALIFNGLVACYSLVNSWYDLPPTL